MSYLHPYAVVKQLIEVEHPVHAHVHPEVEVMGAWDQIKAPFFGRGSLLGTASFSENGKLIGRMWIMCYPFWPGKYGCERRYLDHIRRGMETGNRPDLVKYQGQATAGNMPFFMAAALHRVKENS